MLAPALRLSEALIRTTAEPFRNPLGEVILVRGSPTAVHLEPSERDSHGLRGVLRHPGHPDRALAHRVANGTKAPVGYASMLPAAGAVVGAPSTIGATVGGEES